MLSLHYSIQNNVFSFIASCMCVVWVVCLCERDSGLVVCVRETVVWLCVRDSRLCCVSV